jgi:hypothetical protein
MLDFCLDLERHPRHAKPQLLLERAFTHSVQLGAGRPCRKKNARLLFCQLFLVYVGPEPVLANTRFSVLKRHCKNDVFFFRTEVCDDEGVAGVVALRHRVATLKKNGSVFFECFPMFVPSLSW